MNIRPIHNESDYDTVVARIDQLIDYEPVSDEAAELEILSILVHDYESRVRPMLPPTPIEAILSRLEQQGLERKDLEPILASRAKVSEVLSGKRELSKDMIRKLHGELQIPYEVLMRPQAGREVVA